jgi:hypothetical protein
MAVYKHRGKWMWDFVKNGTRHREGGYETKQEAIEDEARARTFARKINMDFVNLCDSRLEELKMRRSKGHYERNKLLFDNLKKKWAINKTVTRQDVENYLNEVVLKSKHKANRYLALIKALYNHGVERQWFDYNPTKGIKPFGIERTKKYIPPIEDIKAVLSQASDAERKYLLALLYTMARMREINPKNAVSLV